ncbi:MAG: hypothetical protein GTO41_10120, partial [Burkholderiales bacterium]|nr:hypothetical protein [Burkholderiales bacterium]
MHPDTPLQQAYRGTLIVCGAMIASLFPYLLVVEIVRRQIGPDGYLVDAEQIELLQYVFFILALLPYVIPQLIKRHLAVAAPRESMETLLARLRTATLLSYVLSEVPAVFGLVLFFLAGAYKAFYALWFLSLV